MILTCPACATRYLVDSAAIGEQGRRVRCARCGNSWNQQPEAAPPPEPRRATPRPEPSPDRPRPIPPGSNLPALRRQERRSTSAAWIGFAAVLVGLAAATVLGRERIVAAWPPAKPFYQAVGLWREPQFGLRGIKVNPDGAEAVMIEGEILNSGDAVGAAPGLKVSLLGDDGKEVHGWSVPPGGAAIKPGEARPFRTRGESSTATRKVVVTLLPR